MFIGISETEREPYGSIPFPKKPVGSSRPEDMYETFLQRSGTYERQTRDQAKRWFFHRYEHFFELNVPVSPSPEEMRDLEVRMLKQDARGRRKALEPYVPCVGDIKHEDDEFVHRVQKLVCVVRVNDEEGVEVATRAFRTQIARFRALVHVEVKIEACDGMAETEMLLLQGVREVCWWTFRLNPWRVSYTITANGVKLYKAIGSIVEEGEDLIVL